MCGLALAFFIPSATAGEGHLQLVYKVYVVGIHAANLDLRVSFDVAASDRDTAGFDLDSTAYAVRGRFKTTGLAKALTRWKITVYSRGTLVLGDVVPVTAGYRSKHWFKKRLVELGFDDRTPTLVRMRPPKKPKVSRSRLKGALDPASAFLAVLSHFDTIPRCGLRIPIFNGGSLYELVGESDGAAPLELSGSSPFTAPAVTCRLRLQKKTKPEQESDNGGTRDDPAVQLRMARVFDEMPPVPVQLASDTRYGSLIAPLVRAKLDEGGRTREVPTRQR